MGRWASGQPEGSLKVAQPTPLVETHVQNQAQGGTCPSGRHPRHPGRAELPSSPSVGAQEAGGQGHPHPALTVRVRSSQSNVALSLQVVAGRPKSLADPAAEKPSPRPRAWRLGTGHPRSPQCTRRGTVTAGPRSPTACGRTGLRLQVGVWRGSVAGYQPVGCTGARGPGRGVGPA